MVSDRYVLSSLAYQAVATGDAAWVAAINAKAPAPDLTVFLRVRPAVALRRRYAATAEREIFEVPEFQRRVHRAYGRALARLVEPASGSPSSAGRSRWTGSPRRWRARWRRLPS